MNAGRRRVADQIWGAIRSCNSTTNINNRRKLLVRSLSGPTKLREIPFRSSPKVLEVPWLYLQHRGVKITGTDVKLGNIIERNGRLYQVELRDVESGLKSTERLRTSEAIEHGMQVTLQFYDGRALSATVPPRVTCTVVEAEPSFKGQTLTPHFAIYCSYRCPSSSVQFWAISSLGPAFVDVGDKIVVNTTDDSYMTRQWENPKAND